MAKTLTIDAVTGITPYQIFLCNPDGSSCFYISTTSTIPYSFQIPVPYDSNTSYRLKLIDGNGCIITANS